MVLFKHFVCHTWVRMNKQISNDPNPSQHADISLTSFSNGLLMPSTRRNISKIVDFFKSRERPDWDWYPQPSVSETDALITRWLDWTISRRNSMAPNRSMRLDQTYQSVSNTTGHSSPVHKHGVNLIVVFCQKLGPVGVFLTMHKTHGKGMQRIVRSCKELQVRV